MPRRDKPLNIAFVHQYFPGQFAHLARRFVQDGHIVLAFSRGMTDGRSSVPVDGVRVIDYGHDVPTRAEGAIGGTVQFVREAASMATQAQLLRETGVRPDIIYSHTGWGSASFLHDVFPRAKYVKFCEWYYNNTARSTEYLNPGGRDLAPRMATATLNFPILADLAQGDAFVSPTEWQKSQFPSIVRDRIEVVPDGVDITLHTPIPDASYRLPDGRRVGAKDRIVTYVARGADPFRGFEPFLQALARLQQVDPAVEAIVVGDRMVYYGAGAGTDEHFRAVIARTGFDPARTHFVGKVSYDDYRTILHISSAHVYLTVPFVLSWSLIEAMATGCAIVGSDTAPVREFIADGHNGLLANYFSVEEIAGQIGLLLTDAALNQRLRSAARKTIQERWSLDIAIDRHLAICDRLLDQAG